MAKKKIQSLKGLASMNLKTVLAASLICMTLMFSGCRIIALPYGDLDIDADENSTSAGLEQEILDETVKIEKPESNKQEGDKVTSAGEAFNSVTEVYYAVSDSVVEITTESVQTGLFGPYVESGAGSGVIIEKSGIIVTNYHVIKGAKTVTVRLKDGNEYSASLIGSHPDGDIAVIKIDAGDKELTVAPLGCSADLEVGEDIIVLGNPLGSLGGTLTTGIISAKDRIIDVDGVDMVLLQTNAAVNPGNSGGGMFNMAGELVGIINAKISETGVEGLGFAIPIDVAYCIIEDIINYGYVRGGVDSGLTVLQVTNQNLPFAYANYGITSTGVIIIESRYTNELKLGDKILAIDGKAITTVDEITILLKSYKVGDIVRITIQRGSDTVRVDLKLREKMPETVDFN